MKKILLIVLCLCISLMPVSVLGASRGNEYLYVCDLGQASTDAFRYSAYFKGRWIQVTAPISQTSDVKLMIYEDLDQTPDSKDKRVYNKTFKNTSVGTFTSPEIFLDFRSSSTIPYRVELYADDALLYTATVYRMLLELNGNTLCTRGIRFRDYNTAITDQWMMFTPVDLYAIPSNYGKKEIDLVASNMYIVGKFSIIRNGDQFMFTIDDIDTWSKNNPDDKDANFYAKEKYVDINDPYYPLDADHGIDISKVRISLMGSLSWVESVEWADMDTFFKTDRWYSIEQNLGGLSVWVIYLNGRVSYDPNGLPRLSDDYGNSNTSSLYKLIGRLSDVDMDFN